MGVWRREVRHAVEQIETVAGHEAGALRQVGLHVALDVLRGQAEHALRERRVCKIYEAERVTARAVYRVEKKDWCAWTVAALQITRK